MWRRSEKHQKSQFKNAILLRLWTEVFFPIQVKLPIVKVSQTENCNMKFLFVAAALMFAASITGAAAADIVMLEFYKDNCDKFLKSEPSDHQIYLSWATGRISRELKKDPKTAGINVDNAAASQWIQDYCTAHPDAAFVDATDGAKVQIANPAKP